MKGKERLYNSVIIVVLIVVICFARWHSAERLFDFYDAQLEM